LFENWGPPWLSIFGTLADETKLRMVAECGYMNVAVGLSSGLYQRFRDESLKVCATSNLYRSSLEKFFSRGPSLKRIVKLVKSGRANIAQSDRFIRRLIEINDAYELVLCKFEVVGWFVPGGVTMAQYRLPIGENSRFGNVGDGLASGGGTMAEVLRDRNDESWRGF